MWTVARRCTGSQLQLVSGSCHILMRATDASFSSLIHFLTQVDYNDFMVHRLTFHHQKLETNITSWKYTLTSVYVQQGNSLQSQWEFHWIFHL